MSSRNYPPQEIFNPPSLEKKNFEHIILWMLYNNKECEWSDFIQEPLEISTSTLSRYLTTLINEKYINKISKGHYKITSEGKRRFHDLSKVKKKKRTLSYPPEIMLKSRNYDHWILWMLYNNNYCKWADFLAEPLSINQSSLSKTMKLMIRNGYVGKDDDKKEYRITQVGKSEYSRMLQYYDLDRQTILEEESKRIEEVARKTLNFFDEFNINDTRTQFRFLNNVLKLDYNRVESLLKNEDDFHKILLYLSLNHPVRYPEYISSEEFSRKYGIKENTLTYYIDEIVENNIYPIKFFKLKVPPGNFYYFQENEKLETIIRAITEDSISEFTYLDKLFSRSIDINTTLNSILEEITDLLFDERLKESLREFLPNYINYLAYKIEAKVELKEEYDKLEGIIWQGMLKVFQTQNSEDLEKQYKKELEEINQDIEKTPKNLELYYSKIKILIYFDQIDEIINLLDEMLEIFPESEKDIKMKKASVLKRIKEVKDGFEIINELLQKYPKDNELLVYKAYWLQYLNKEEESLDVIRDLIKRNPETGIYYDTYGEILMYFQDYQNAIKQFQKVIEIANNEWYINQTYIKLGICYKELKSDELAVKNLKKGKEMTNSASTQSDIKEKWNKIADIFLAEIEEL
ncbi:MAG: hypothetical protein ACFFB0_01825 [Promethearchaeota archaeon]